MNTLQAIFLGIIQGLTEFFPVSSSGHLKFFEAMMGFSLSLIFFDLICHLGTLLAIFNFYSKDIYQLCIQKKQTLWMLLISILPLFPMVLLHKELKHFYSQPKFLCYFFLFTSLCLVITSYLPKGTPLPNCRKKNYLQALFIGCFQTLALLPGISRSGITLMAGRLMGWRTKEALDYSFLLAIPTILGAVILEIKELKPQDWQVISLSSYALAFLFSWVIGLLSLNTFIKLVSKGKLWFFSLYCLFMSFMCYLFINTQLSF